MWVTMGPIANRTHERLGASDLAIVEFRKQMIEAVRSFQQGAPAIGTGELAMPRSVCSFQAIVPKTTDWRDFAVRPVLAGGADDAEEMEPSYSVQAA
jgi:phthalate 4,5-dioxygenase oxygenase subunit